MACIIFLLGSAGLDLASLQPCQLPTMIPILQMRKFKHWEANQHLHGTTLNTWWSHSVARSVRIQGSCSHCILIGILFQVALVWSLYSVLALISFWPIISFWPYNAWATLRSFPAWAAVLREPERKTVRCPVLCEGVQAQHPARRAKADKWGAILKTFGATMN